MGFLLAFVAALGTLFVTEYLLGTICTRKLVGDHRDTLSWQKRANSKNLRGIITSRCEIRNYDIPLPHTPPPLFPLWQFYYLKAGNSRARLIVYLRNKGENSNAATNDPT